MPRHFLNEPDVRPLVQELIAVVLHEGSVNAAHRKLTSVLADDRSEGWLYPNRLHSILSADSSRAINSDTLAVLGLALSRLPIDLRDPNGAGVLSSGLRVDALRAWEAAPVGVEDSDESARLLRAADRLNLPPAVTLWLLKDAAAPDGAVLSDDKLRRNGGEDGNAQPDWSFQDTAHSRCVDALAKGINRKVGLVLPTGGGKTRVAMRIALSLLDASDREDTVVLWVTHRTRLKTQAHRELQRAMNQGTPNLPEGAARLLGRRVDFCMLSDLERRLTELQDNVELVIVDEAHHAAATSYQAIFDHRPLRGLFLTATPNRTDALPIGIDEIAYTITSRELFDRHVILEPRLETLDLFDFAWDDTDQLRNLADYLLDRAQSEFLKTLVAASTVEHAISLHTALVSVLEDDDTAILSADDLGFVHGSGSSTGDSPDVFLDEFARRPRGIVVATTQLLGEGFDDTSINAVVVTYPTSSVLQLMQVAGRCLRSAPGKHTAYVVQMRKSPLAYHWEQRWLYQDISDALRPQLADRNYSSIDDLVSQIEEVLTNAHVRSQVARAVHASIKHVQVGEQVALLMTGLPYGGSPDTFEENAAWHAVAVTNATRDAFLRIFNGFSSRGTDVNDFDDYLRNYIQPDPAPSGEWKQYKDMLWGMSYAHREITGEAYDAASARPYDPAIGTTWLRYITFRYEPGMPSALDAFLADAINREEIAAEHQRSPQNFTLAIKVPLPLAGSIAFLLDEHQAAWLSSQRSDLRARLEDAPHESFGVLADWRYSLPYSPLSPLLVDQFDRFLRTDALEALTLALAS
jgi:superfamily II DNA or RNA helicase